MAEHEYFGNSTGRRLLEKLKTALGGKANQSEVDRLSKEIADKLPKNMGAANVGKFLVVGTDGNIVLIDMPEGGASADVVGVIDENNNILLSGDLADGTYYWKFVYSDGTSADIGSLVVGAIPKPVEPTNILTSGDYEITLNKRWSGSAADYRDCNGMITIHIPMADVLNKTIYFKGFALTQASNQDVVWLALNSDMSEAGRLKSGASDSPLGDLWESSHLTNNNGVYSVPINTTSFSNINSAGYLSINMAVAESAITEIPDTMIMTIGEEIV